MLLCSSAGDSTARSLAKVKFSVCLPAELLLPPAAVLERDEERKCLEAVEETGGGNYVYASLSCLKPRWRKAKQIIQKEMVCAVAMTTKRKGQMLSPEELPSTSRNQTASANSLHDLSP